MKRYLGNTGTVENIPDSTSSINEGSHSYKVFPEIEKRPSSKSSLLGEIGGLFSRILHSVPETEDLLMVAVLYLMYKESGDIEFLLIAGAMLIL